MSIIGSKVSTIESIPTNTPDQERRAALKVCEVASDADDARDLLEALGLAGAPKLEMQAKHYELCVRQLHRMTPDNVTPGERGGRKCIMCLKAASQQDKSCANGHPMTVENTHVQPKGRVLCKICMKDSDMRARSKRRVNGGRRSYKKYCVNGHPWTEENTQFKSNGARQCRQCWKVFAGKRIDNADSK